MIKWLTVPASQYCDSVRDGTHDSPKACSDGYKLITSKHIFNGVIDKSNANTISESDYISINKRSKVEINDILFSMIGTVGNVCRVSEEPDYAIKNMGLFKVSDELRSKYLYIYLRSRDAREYVHSSLAGSTQQYLSLKALRCLPVRYPDSTTTMRQIVSVVDAIETKIAANNLLNDYLDERCRHLKRRFRQTSAAEAINLSTLSTQTARFPVFRFAQIME